MLFYSTLLIPLLCLFSPVFPSEKKDLDYNQLFCLINHERNASQVPCLLRIGKKLNAAADFQAQHQANIDQITHTGPKGSNVGQRVDKHKFEWLSVAENVACGHDNVPAVVHAWMCSPGHKANMLDPKHKVMGAASYISSKKVAYWTLVLASSKSDKAEKVDCEKYKADIEALIKLDKEPCKH